jgi:hypothetical protein
VLSGRGAASPPLPDGAASARTWVDAIRRNDLVQLFARAVWVEGQRRPRLRRAVAVG